MQRRETDVLVVGAGIAGLATALSADRKGADVTLVTKAVQPTEASTWRAQGGIAITRSDPDSLKADILDASGGTASETAVDVLVEHADEAVREVLVDTIGVEFDTDSTGEYEFGREAAHKEPRVLHVNAETGKHIHVPFLNYVLEETDVTVLDDTAALELVSHEGRIHGAVLERAGKWAPTFAGATVLATGGIGGLYQRTTNPPSTTGDGIAMAALAGARVEDMEFIQFHPTGCETDTGTFLISEAVRGEGAVLRNAAGKRFMPAEHPDAELAPRDVVARAVMREHERTGGVELDVTGIDFSANFPGLAATCETHDVDWETGIPVIPVQHFLCGGIAVDDVGKTSLDGLFAVGECARTGVHGANRLASTSLLEGLVWGLRAGEAATGHRITTIEPPELLDRDPALPANFAQQKFVRLRSVMEESLGVVRSPSEIDTARAGLRRLKGEVDAYVRTRTSRSLYELRAATIVAVLVARAAAENEQSVGCHHVNPSTDTTAEGETMRPSSGS